MKAKPSVFSAGMVVMLSHVISEKTPLYGGRGRVRIRQSRAIHKGDSCNMMSWVLPNHAGTHVDAPLHFIRKGRSITDYRPDEWIFRKVSLIDAVSIRAGELMTARHMGNVCDCELLLIKTGFERRRAKSVYWQSSPGLHPALAHFLRKKCPSLRAIGLDFISVSSLKHRDLGREAHRAFLSEDFLLLEDMRLSVLKKPPALVIAAPLLVHKADGAPCSVFGFISKKD